ncbi:MAG: rhomboid family intramembrane serine protease [Bacteroidales bacterium]|nr:MAG: rhomboid family intramembrane serine protease [Bacteroidales bacterium]
MIPLRDTKHSERFPIVNWLIIIVNIIVFIYELTLNGAEAEAFFYKFGLVPSQTNLTSGNQYTFFTNMFLHGGWGHFIGNMWVLYIFGDNVEDRMGKVRYFFFYIIAGLIASFTHYMLHRNSPVPAIGASGAISGIMAAYMFLFPRSKILSFVPVFFIPLLIPIPAFIFIAIWFIGQVFNGTYTLLFSPTATGIAFWAHIGGFLGGLILYKFFLSRKRKRKKKKY